MNIQVGCHNAWWNCIFAKMNVMKRSIVVKKRQMEECIVNKCNGALRYRENVHDAAFCCRGGMCNGTLHCHEKDASWCFAKECTMHIALLHKSFGLNLAFDDGITHYVENMHAGNSKQHPTNIQFQCAQINMNVLHAEMPSTLKLETQQHCDATARARILCFTIGFATPLRLTTHEYCCLSSGAHPGMFKYKKP